MDKLHDMVLKWSNLIYLIFENHTKFLLDATIYVGGLDEKVTEAILWELFVNAGPVTTVNMPKDRITGTHQGFGFIEFMSEEDADYAIKIMNMIKLFGKPIKGFLQLFLIKFFISRIRKFEFTFSWSKII